MCGCARQRGGAGDASEWVTVPGGLDAAGLLGALDCWQERLRGRELEEVFVGEFAMSARVWGALLCCLICGCAGAPRRLSYFTLQSAAMGKSMDYAVYAPVSLAPAETLPLVIFLHGGGDDVDCLDKAGFGGRLDEAIAAGRLPKMIIAVPQGNWGFWENWADGTRKFRSWVMDEMLPHVQAKYHTQACPEGCHVMGISMGGYGALRFALKLPDSFVSVTALSAPIFDTEQMLEFRESTWWSMLVPVGRIWGKSKDPVVLAREDLFVQWSKPQDLKGRRLHLAWAKDDRKEVIETSQKFRTHLLSRHIPHSWEIFPGDHEWDAWVPALERALALQLQAQSPVSAPAVPAVR